MALLTPTDPTDPGETFSPECRRRLGYHPAVPAVDRWLTDHLGGVLAAEPRDY